MALSKNLRKIRHYTSTAGTRPNSDINITPLVDVVLVLLIIFMVVTPLLEKDIEVKVPETEQEDTPQDVPKDQLIVSINEAGEVSLNQEKIAWDQYVDKLKRVLAAKAGDKLIFFMADEKANYAKVIGALDGARQAGADILGMMTEVNKDANSAAPGAPGLPTSSPPPATQAAGRSSQGRR